MIGGLDFVTVSGEPPELQILILRVATLPAWTFPKFMTGVVLHPPSDVSMPRVPMGLVVALADIRVYWLPPSDQIVNMLEYRPTVSV